MFERATFAAHECDVFLVVGTSAVVYPAADLIPVAKGHRDYKPDPGVVVECNLARTEASRLADVGVYGPSGVTLPAVLTRLGL